MFIGFFMSCSYQPLMPKGTTINRFSVGRKSLGDLSLFRFRSKLDFTPAAISCQGIELELSLNLSF